MLKIIGCQNCGKTEIEFGDYLPFKFWNNAKSTAPKLYWRTGNFNSTLLEVEIDSVAGQIIGASLLLPGDVSRDFPILNLSDDCRSYGYPVVATSDWPDGRIKDEPGAFHVFVDANRLLMMFSELVATERTISSDNVTFGLDANDFIVWMLIGNLPAEKLAELENL